MTTVSATAQAHPQRQRRHRHRFLSFIQLYAYKLFFAHLGKFIVVAVYYILLETMRGQHTSIFSWQVTLPDVKGTWDSLLSATTAQGGFVHLMSPTAWDSMRHVVFRGVLEGVLGVVLFNQIGFNVTKYREKKKAQLEAGKTPNRYLVKVFASPYQKHPVTPLQYVMLPIVLLLVTIIVGVPVYLGIHTLAVHTAHWLEPSLPAHQSLIQRLYVGDYDGIIVGIIVGVVAGRTYRAYLFANTMNYGRTWVAKGRRAHWWMPYPTRYLIADLCEQGQAHQREVLAERHSSAATVAGIGGLVAIGLAIYGWYILQYVA